VATWRDADDELSPLLEIALDAFFRFGYHATSVRDIAQRLKVTVPVLYYYHENKEAILFSLLDGSITSVISRCEQAIAEAPDEPGATFRYLVECLVLYMAQHGKRAAMDAEIRALGAKNRRRYVAKRNIVEQMMKETIADGIARGAFHVTSPRDTSRALLGMIWAITVWYKPGGRMSPAALAKSYVDIALHTVGARHAGPSRR
jgi:AcrR family transcriptional regulator